MHANCENCILVPMTDFDDDLEIGDIIHRREFSLPIYFEVVGIEEPHYRICEGNH